jgi:hypothetical protein
LKKKEDIISEILNSDKKDIIELTAIVSFFFSYFPKFVRFFRGTFLFPVKYFQKLTFVIFFRGTFFSVKFSNVIKLFNALPKISSQATDVFSLLGRSTVNDQNHVKHEAAKIAISKKGYHKAFILLEQLLSKKHMVKIGGGKWRAKGEGRCRVKEVKGGGGRRREGEDRAKGGKGR